MTFPKRRIRLPKNFTPTHQTGGLGNKFPAIDVFAPPKTLVYPPEKGVIVYKHYIEWDHDERVGGWTCYLHGVSGNTYFLTHFHSVRREGRIWPFMAIGRVGEVPMAWWPAHIHEGKHEGIYNP